jgi:predicted component of type VI protein secretion system
MRNLLDEIAQSLGLRRSNAEVETADIQGQLADMHGRMDEFEHRLRTMEEVVNRFIETFEGKLQDLARRGLKAKRQTSEELEALHRDLAGYIDILERAVETQLDMARRQDIRRLLASARAKRRHVQNVIALKVANSA